MIFFFAIWTSGVLLVSVQAHEVKLCEHRDWKGRCINPDISRLCYDLRDFDNIASSINTNGHCVLLWEHRGCVGENRRVAPGTPSHGNLGAIGFDDRTSSIQLCPREQQTVQLCEDKQHKKCVDLTVSERCQSLGKLDNKISSAQTNGHCIILWDKKGCSGDKRRVAPGTPSHRDFDGIQFNDKASSVQLCPRVKFRLYANSSDEGSHKEIRWGDGNSMKQIRLNGNSRIKIYHHGFRDSGFSSNSLLIKNSYLRESTNQQVIIVDWEPLADEPTSEYSVVSQNHVPIVAAHVRQFLADVKANRAITSLDQIHLIGHGLGGQMCGLIGEGIKSSHCGHKVARISALDPAGQDYWGKPTDKRVDESDAKFVDAIHMNTTVGYNDRVAHADFYANPEQSDPANHDKAVRLFALSIRHPTICGCRVEGSRGSRMCTNDCDKNIVFGEHINENARGEYCFNREA